MLLIDIKIFNFFVSFNSEVNGEEKIAIKSVLISSFREPVPQIAVQIAELIARIARYVLFEKEMNQSSGNVVFFLNS